MPVMDLVAGPQGSGKSLFFPVSTRGKDWFNIDDCRKELNLGSSQNIPAEIRRESTAKFEAFILAHIEAHRSFSVEVTLAKEVTFQQAALAKRSGFRIEMTYIAAEAEICLDRVEIRVDEGGHGFPPEELKRIHAASLANLARAIREFDFVEVYDNSLPRCHPRPLLESEQGIITFADLRFPDWLKKALQGTEYSFG